MKSKSPTIIVLPSVLNTLMVLIAIVISAYSLKKAHSADKMARKHAESDQRDMSMLRLGAIIENSIDRQFKNDFEKAVYLRNKIYQQVPLKTTPNGFPFMKFIDSYFESLRDDSVGHICGGLAKTYALALESQGIPARYVAYFTSDQHPYDSHATIEFWYEGKWYASDPTFNVMYKSGGRFLSYEELYPMVHEGGPYAAVTNGFPIFPERALEKYPLTPKVLMKFLSVHPSVVWSEGKKHSYPKALFPDSWDGAITYEDGKRRDVREFSGLYKYLNKGPLR